MAIQDISQKNFVSAVVDIDNKRFFGCIFYACTLRYSGGEFAWDKYAILKKCIFEFVGNSPNVEKVRDTFGIGQFNLLNKAFSAF